MPLQSINNQKLSFICRGEVDGSSVISMSPWLGKGELKVGSIISQEYFTLLNKEKESEKQAAFSYLFNSANGHNMLWQALFTISSL